MTTATETTTSASDPTDAMPAVSGPRGAASVTPPLSDATITPAPPDAASPEANDPAAAHQRRGFNPVYVMIGVGLVMLGVIAVASMSRQSFGNAIQAGATTATGQIAIPGQTGGELPKAGNLAPDFTLTDIQGNEVKLSDLRGRPVLLNFWATWCPPCRTEMPEFEDLHRRHPNLAVVGVNLREDPAHVARFVQNAGYTWTFLLDTTGATTIRYAVAALPTTLFINPDGTIQDIRVGGMNKKEIDQRAARLLTK